MLSRSSVDALESAAAKAIDNVIAEHSTNGVNDSFSLLHSSNDHILIDNSIKSNDKLLNPKAREAWLTISVLITPNRQLKDML